MQTQGSNPTDDALTNLFSHAAALSPSSRAAASAGRLCLQDLVRLLGLPRQVLLHVLLGVRVAAALPD